MLQDALATHPPCAPPLPLSHSTAAKWLTKIMTASGLGTQLCPVFGIPLLYTYYGPAVYRKITDPTTGRADRPMAFVLKASTHDGAKDVYPFDSGACHSGRFSKFLGSLPLSEFRVDPVGNGSGKIVSRFFIDNPTYLRGEPALKGSLDPHEDALCQLYNATGKQDFDMRSRSVEVIFDTDLPFVDHLDAVVLPRSISEHYVSLVTALKSYTPEVRSYWDYPISSTQDNYAKIEEKVMELFELWGLT